MLRSLSHLETSKAPTLTGDIFETRACSATEAVCIFAYERFAVSLLFFIGNYVNSCSVLQTGWSAVL